MALLRKFLCFGVLTAGLAATGLGLGLAPRPAWADPGLTCAGRVIGPGDRAGEVEQLCGPPDSRQKRLIERESVISGKVDRSTGLKIAEKVLIEGETWSYSARAGRLARILTFEDGVLTAIQVGG